MVNANSTRRAASSPGPRVPRGARLPARNLRTPSGGRTSLPLDGARAGVSPPSARSTLRARLREQNRAAFIDAAEHVCVHQGPRHARMEDVAATAGVAVGTLYNYFDDRAALVAALLAARRAELDAALALADPEDDAPFACRLVEVFATLFAHHQRHPGLHALQLDAALDARSSAAASASEAADVHARLERIARAAVREGALRSVDAPLLPALAVGAVRALLEAGARAGGTPPGPRDAVRLVRLLVDGTSAAQRGR